MGSLLAFEASRFEFPVPEICPTPNLDLNEPVSDFSFVSIVLYCSEAKIITGRGIISRIVSWNQPYYHMYIKGQLSMKSKTVIAIYYFKCMTKWE